jgi:Flp pilus assembly protein TadD
LEPGLFDAHFNLGVVLQALEQVNEAIDAYKKALSLGKDPGALNNLGAAYLKRRDFPMAIRCCEQALELKPEYADALHNLGTALQENGQAEAAVAHFEKCARLPNPPPALPGQFALALQQCGRLEEAETWYRQALKTRPTPSVCSNLAVILEQRFAFPEAEQLLR